ncbi:MAG: zinc ribbon domain-containing protein [Actinomycetota bacterium]|nr:zinc ribbon domain-containing protein [Actinomycetota bacterium]
MFNKEIKIFSLFLICLLLLSQPAGALAVTPLAGTQTEASKQTVKTTEVGTPLESLTVRYQPEYDDPSVLVIYTGKVDASIKTPATIKIAIPKGKGIRLSATSSIDPNGQFQYDQAWNSKQLVDLKDMTILTYETTYPDFQFEMYMQPVSGGGKRNFDFSLPSISKIKALSVDIKQPVRAENFKTTPAAAGTAPDGQFKDYFYSYANVVPGRNYAFNVTYNRADSMPSVDKKTGVVDTSGGSSRVALILILMIVLIGLGIGVGVWRAKTAATTPTKGRPIKATAQGKGKGKNKGGAAGASKQPASAKAGGKNFCPSCGAQSPAESKFCSDCGTTL